MISDVLRLRGHQPLHQQLHVCVNGPHLEEPGQELSVVNQANKLVPECLQTPLVSDCQRWHVFPPAKLIVDPGEDALEVHPVLLQEVVQLGGGWSIHIANKLLILTSR